MRKLRVSTADLMQVHNRVDVERHLETLAQWKHDGRVRYIGVTHYTGSAHVALERVISKHSVDPVQINSPRASGEVERRILLLPGSEGSRCSSIALLRKGISSRVCAIDRCRRGPTRSTAAAERSFLLKFVVPHPAVTCAIRAMSNVAHLRDNAAQRRGRMPDESLRRRIADAFAKCT